MSAQRQLIKIVQTWQAVQLSHTNNHVNHTDGVNRSNAYDNSGIGGCDHGHCYHQHWSLSSRLLVQSYKTVVDSMCDVQGSQTASFSVGMAEAFRQQGVSLSVFSTYPPGQSNPVWPSLLYKLFEHAEQVRQPHPYPANITSVCKTSYSQVCK